MSPARNAQRSPRKRSGGSSARKPGKAPAEDRRTGPHPVQLNHPPVDAQWLPEPELVFAEGNRHIDPKTGLTLWGPASLGTERHREKVRVGFVGLASAIDNVRFMIAEAAEGIEGGATHHPFPGFADSIRTEISCSDDRLSQILTINDHRDLTETKNGRQRFQDTLAVLDHKIKLLAERDDPPDLVFVVFDPALYNRTKVTDYREHGSAYHRDMRRALKAAVMKHRIPIQLVQETTTRRTPTVRRQLDHPTEVAWNLATGVYFKTGGLPWGPTGLPPDTCFVGVSFTRPLGSDSTLHTSVVQAFDEHGEGLVLRGPDFKWDPRQEGRSPHFPAETAKTLLDMVLNRYRAERGNLPRRVVVHKSSKFEPAEREGCHEALRGVELHDLVALTQTSDWRLLRAGRYPPLRGTVLTAGSHSMLYTTGWISNLGYDHGHVPSPVRIADHVGDTPSRQLLSEILTLTKMNWNSSAFSETLPITLRFARDVGDILRELPEESEPRPEYRYYM